MRKNKFFCRLNRPQIRGFFCLALLLLSPSVALPQQQKKGLMPVAPEILFSVLPEKVKGWKLKRSKGRLNIGLWLESEVLREFHQEPQQASEKKVKAASAIFTIKDTAKAKGGELELFDDFTPGKVSGENYEFLYLGGVPAIVIDYKSKGIEVQFLIKNRFLLTISLRDQPSSEMGNWFKKVNLSILERIPEGQKFSLPDEFTAIEIDELDPSKSSRYNSSAALTESPEEEFEDPDSDEKTNRDN